MAWEDLVPGDWTMGASEGLLDPYLVWTEATGFVDFALMSARGASPEAPDVIPVLIELDQKELDRMAGPMALQQLAVPSDGLPQWARVLLRLLDE